MSTPARDIVTARRGKWYGTYGYIKCPAHDDRNPSCSVRDGETGVPLVNCKLGCERADIIRALKEEGAWPEYERSSRPAYRPNNMRRYASPSRAPIPIRTLSEKEQ